MESKWIKVEDQLPDDIAGQRVIARAGMPYFMWFSCEKFYMTLGDIMDNKPVKGVTHWMPSPEPPKN